MEMERRRQRGSKRRRARPTVPSTPHRAVGLLAVNNPTPWNAPAASRSGPQAGPRLDKKLGEEGPDSGECTEKRTTNTQRTHAHTYKTAQNSRTHNVQNSAVQERKCHFPRKRGHPNLPPAGIGRQTAENMHRAFFKQRFFATLYLASWGHRLGAKFLPKSI